MLHLSGGDTHLLSPPFFFVAFASPEIGGIENVTSILNSIPDVSI